MMTLVVTVDIEMCFPHSTNNLKVLIHSFLTQVADGRTPMLLRRKPVKVKPEIWYPIETVPQRMVTSCPKPVSGSTHRYRHPLPLLLSIARSIIQTAAWAFQWEGQMLVTNARVHKKEFPAKRCNKKGWDFFLNLWFKPRLFLVTPGVWAECRLCR